jgi:chromosome segregation ATPase
VELKTKIDNIKEEVIHDMENLRKKNETEIQKKMEAHSSRIEQAEDRISELEDAMVIKGKTEELLVRQLKSCERNMQELTDFIKRPNLRIMDIEKGEEVQAKGICNILNKIITENFPNHYLTHFMKPILLSSQNPTKTPPKRRTTGQFP